MPKRSPRRLIIAVLLAIAFEGIAFSLSAATNAPFIFTARRADGGNLWQLSWQTQPGVQYTLQKSADLARWTDVVTVTAESNSVTRLASAIPNETKTFWRVVTFPNGRQKGESEPLTVSSVVVSYQLGGAASRALLRVITGGTQTVNSVVFFDNGMLLGNALPGLGNTWTFDLVWDGRTPQTRQVSATVTTEEGVTNETPVIAFLLADPSKLVPVNADGTRAYGEFVSVDGAGNLGAFLFYPEGLGDAATVTGAYFEFPPGAALRTQGAVNEIEFTAAKFYRGHQDTAPIIANAGTRRIDIDAATPTAVAGALGLPVSSMNLLWGSVPLRWLDGALSERGWAALTVRPPIGDFALPNGQECALVSFDPKSNDPTLIVCYHGSWAPFEGGPQFQIPRAEPLKIYLSLSGRIAAHGTVEAIFSNGATVRGSVSWREPNFEVRLQGRNIVIPALTSLKRALPANPEQLIPTGNTTTELDAAAQALASFRDTYRALAMGGLAEASTASTETLAPLGEPTDPAGTALQAWASRLASWTADRAGQVLDAQQLADLRKVVENAAKTGQAAHDLPTVLKLLRDVLLVSKHLDSAASAGERASVRAQIDDAQARLFSAAERIAAGAAAFEPSGTFSEIVTLLREATANESAVQPAGLAATKAASPDLEKLLNLVKAKIGPRFAQRVRDAAANLGLAGLSSTELLNFVEELSVYHQLLNFAGSQLPPGAPTAQQINQAAVNIRPHFANNSENSLTDYTKVRSAVLERARFFQLYDRLGIRMASDADFGFFRSTPGLVQTFVDQFNNLPFADHARACRQDLGFFSVIAEHTSDSGSRVNLEAAATLMNNCDTRVLDALAQSSQSTRCDDLAQALLHAGFKIAPRNPAQEGNAFPDITGLYESVADASEQYITLQLNQGGRFFKGGLQLQVETPEGRSAQYLSWKLEGMFLRQSPVPGTMEFAFRAISTTDGSASFLQGTARREAGNTIVTIGLAQFIQVSSNGVYSDAILEAFEPGRRGSIKASQQSPMHSRIVARTMTDAANLRFTLDQYFSNSASRSDEQAAATELQNKLQRIDRRLTANQRPIAAALIRRVLSTALPKTVQKSRITGNVTDAGNQTVLYWDLLLALTLRENLNLAAQLGMTSEQFQELQARIGQDSFHYEITVRQASATAGELFLTFGAGELDVTVKKHSPSGQLLDTFNLIGFIGSWSPGVGVPLPISCSISTNTYKFDSPLNFVASDFAGPVDFSQFGVNAAIPPGPLTPQLDFLKSLAGIDPSINSWQIGYFGVHGSGRFPAMTFKTDPVSGFAVNGCLFNVGVGVDIGGGHLTAAAPPGEQSILFDPGELVDFDTTGRPHLAGGVFFEINGTNLTECGWQFLREFVAEHHDLLVGAKSKIQIDGHADAVGSGAFNLRLSQHRADSVKRALQGLLGSSLHTSITATGHGEADHDDALGIIDPDNDSLAVHDVLFRRADILVGGVVIATMGAPITTPQ